MKRIVGCLLAVLILVVGGTNVHAQAGGEHIQRFESAVMITPDGVAHVRETVVYDFGATDHHGIYRDVPIDYHDGDTNYYVTANYQAALDENGTQVPAETSEVDGNLRIRLGDPDKTITGVHTYAISYTLSPIIMKKAGKPFLNLDVLGAGWQVPVDSFAASVGLQNGQQLSNVQWYGASGTGSTVEASALPAYHPVTINAFLPDGYVTQFLEPNKPRPFDSGRFLAEYWVLLLIAAIIAGIVTIVSLRKWYAYRKRKAQTIIPEYEPPQGMTPAQIGLLDDDTSSMREVTATVVDWAVRGYVKITRIEKKGWLGSASYQLTQLKKSDLPVAEQDLYDAFFSKGKEVLLKDLDKSKMAQAVSTYKSKLKQQLSDRGYYDKRGSIIKRGNLTDVGAKQWAKVEGFQLYMSVVEKDRLEFSDAPEKTPERFNTLLPFAIALGVEKQWAKQFEGIDVTPATTWYSGNLAAFSAVSLASDLGTSFASVVSTNASVSSSGGSAGGGVGGGGGGSW